MTSKQDVLDAYVGLGGDDEHRTTCLGETLANQIAEAEVVVQWIEDGFALAVDDRVERLGYPVSEEDLNAALDRLGE